MPKIKYQSGIKYGNGSRKIVFRRQIGNTMWFKEDGEVKKLNYSVFCSKGFEPLEPISTGRIKARPSMPKDHYRKGNSLLFRLKE